MHKRKDGRFCERVKLPNGDYKDVYGRTETEVRRKTKAIEAEATAGRKFSELIDSWWDFHCPEIAYNTQQCYIKPIEDIKDGLGDMRVREILPLDIQRFLNNYAHAGGARRAKQTVKLRRTVIRQALDYAALFTGEIDANPALSTKIPKNLPAEIREALTDEQYALVEKSVDKEFGLFPFVLAHTGTRPGEGLALMYEDINFATYDINTSKNLVFQDGGKPVISPTKNKRSRKSLLLQPLVDVLPRNRKGFIFSPDPRRPITEKEYRIRWQRYQQETDADFTPYQCRHYYATLLYEAKVGVKDAQLLLGHAKPSTTLNVYTHIRNMKARRDGLRTQIEGHLAKIF